MQTIKRDDLILQHLSLADKLAWIQIKATPKRISVDELKAAAYMGLVLAAEKYQEGISSFVTYATTKIQGSMRDYVKELKWGTRKSPKKAVSLADVFAKKENNMSWVYYDLKPLEKKIIFMYYEGGYTLKEIGKELNVNESWASQLLNKAKQTIKAQYAA